MLVYGTLKRGAQWHGKYLSRAQFVGNAVSGGRRVWVPYLLRPPLPGDRLGGGKAVEDRRGKNKNIRGELYEVDDECLVGLGEYEGVGKNHYGRQTMGPCRADRAGNRRPNEDSTAHSVICRFLCIFYGKTKTSLRCFATELRKQSAICGEVGGSLLQYSRVYWKIPQRLPPLKPH